MTDVSSKWRFPVGVGVFVLGFGAPLAIPLVVASSLPAGWKTILSGVLAFGVPEVMMVAAAAVLGREGFAELKRLFARWLRTYGPPPTVSRTRYRVGLVMFTLPLLTGWLGPYLRGYLPGFETQSMWWLVGGDLMFLASLLVLGGEFWDKLRALFAHGARAVFNSDDVDRGGPP